MKATKRINVEVLRKKILPTIDAVQFVTGLQIILAVRDFSIPTGTTAKAFFKKPSGKFVYQDCTISGNEITIDVHNQALTEYGNVYYQVKLTNGSDILSTFAGKIEVEKSLADSSATSSETVVPAFDAAVQDAVAEIEEARDSAITYIGNGLDNTLKVEGKAADAAAAGKAIDELKGDLVNATGIYYIDKSELNIGGYLKIDGTLVPLSDTNIWVSSDYIEVSDLNKIYYKLHGLNTSSGIKVANVVFYGVNKTIVDSFYIQETTSEYGEDYIRVIDVPAYCKYIRICSYSGKDHEFMCIKNNVLMPNICDATNYFTSQNGYINTNGVFKESTNSGWYATDYINVSEFNRIDYNLKGTNAVSVVCVYDSNYNLINKVAPTTSSYDVMSGVLDITNGKYIRLCSYGYVGKSLLYSVANKEKRQWENIVNKPYLFNGKNALFFGDSITKGFINGNEITENNYPKLFSDSVGMSFINYGVGGATLSRVDGYSCIYDKIVNATFSNVDFVFVAGGVNDWQLGVSLSDLRTSVTNICNYLKSNFNGEVIFITPIENAGWTPLTTPIADIEEYRNVISEVVLTNGYSLINGKSLNFPNKDSNTLLISTLFGDKLHPTEKGYIQYSKGLRTILC